MFLGRVYGLSVSDRIYLQFSRDPFFLFKKGINTTAKKAGSAKRDIDKGRLDFGARNGFERIVEKILLKHIPDIFFEDSEFCRKHATRIKRWVGMDLYTSNLEIACLIESGGRWISAQHGGAYGHLLSFPMAKIEYAITEGFITWGWRHRHIYDFNHYPLPSPMLSKLKKHQERDDKIIFVGTMVPSYIYRMDSYLVPEQIMPYLNNKVLFLKHLDKVALEKIKYKPYPYDYSTNEREIIGTVLPEGQFLTRGTLSGFFSCSRLAVIDHPSTSFLEALAMNTPTVLFWDPAHFAFCEEVRPFFNRLREAGILFDRPEEAAKKVNEIWPDVKGWWDRPDVQRAKDDFCFQFARTSAAWRKEWAQFVKKL